MSSFKSLTIGDAMERLVRGGLPLRFTALTPCFRSEAGAAGKDGETGQWHCKSSFRQFSMRM